LWYNLLDTQDALVYKKIIFKYQEVKTQKE
jgi:hypothetical protein